MNARRSAQMGIRMKQKLKNMSGKQKGLAALLAAAMIVCAITAFILWMNADRDQVTYRETSVRYGNLVVGITGNGSVDIGTVNQIFELDMSALQRADTSGSGSGSGNSGGMSAGGMGGGGNMQSGLDMFNQIFGMAGNTNYTDSSQDSGLTVSEVCVSVGQQVKSGDPLYYLEEESVSELEHRLKSNVEKARADLEAVYAEQELSRETAEYTLESSRAYGSYASTEYNAAILELENTVKDKKAALEKARKTLAEYREQLRQASEDYKAAAEVLKNCEWSRDNTDKWSSTYDYVQYFQMAQTAKASADSLEQKKEQLENNVEQAESNADTCERELAEAERALEQGKLSAGQTLKLRQLAYSTAQETYDIALGYLKEDVSEQEETCADAEDKWEEFSSHIQGNAVCALYDGVITEVGLEAGDTLSTDDMLVTLYDEDDITMTVTVDEDDMTDIQEGMQANISLIAYPDEIFNGAVTEISDAETDSSGNVTYQVTVTLSGDVSGFFQGMTGEVTFVTKQSEDVLYVSNRAIIREGKKSYVKVRTADGGIRKQEVVTGFSDGVNVEILEGLSEGDTALIESKVKEG